MQLVPNPINSLCPCFLHIYVNIHYAYMRTSKNLAQTEYLQSLMGQHSKTNGGIVTHSNMHGNVEQVLYTV